VKRQVKEYNRLCDLQDAGDEVNQDHLYLLELVVRDRLRESLTQELGKLCRPLSHFNTFAPHSYHAHFCHFAAPLT